jgi:hypothetical protein
MDGGAQLFPIIIIILVNEKYNGGNPYYNESA